LSWSHKSQFEVEAALRRNLAREPRRYEFRLRHYRAFINGRADRLACYTGFLGLACRSIQGGPRGGNICGLIDEPPIQSF